MSNIYQRIWDADQSQNGIKAILDHQEGDENQGFVKVNSNLDDKNQDLRVLSDLHLPEHKKNTYKLGLKLFDNYALSESDEEIDTPEERTEIHNFVEAILDTAPMQVAREYIAEQTGSSVSRQRLYNTLMEMWFRKYAQNGDSHLSGFEHVIIGEQDKSKAKGYHFWYKYYLDDGFAREQDGIYKDSFPQLTDDRIKYHGSKLADGQEQHPESVTISYKWFAPDYDRHGLRPLFKKIGGFFVGCSLEGLLALGTVRGHLGINAPQKAIINGAEYDLKLFHSQNRRHIRTFYPIYLRNVELTSTPPVIATDSDTPIQEPIPQIPSTPTAPITPPNLYDSIKIIAALVNPVGNDVGFESVTMINTSPEDMTINNWNIIDKNNNRTNFSATIKAGETYRLILDGKDAQLSNKGGMIKLLNENGTMVHLVSYNREQVRGKEGKTIVF